MYHLSKKIRVVIVAVLLIVCMKFGYFNYSHIKKGESIETNVIYRREEDEDFYIEYLDLDQDIDTNV